MTRFTIEDTALRGPAIHVQWGDGDGPIEELNIFTDRERMTKLRDALTKVIDGSSPEVAELED